MEKMEWVKVDERLPKRRDDLSVKVLVHYKAHTMPSKVGERIRYWDVVMLGRYDYRFHRWILDGYGEAFFAIDYWMPIVMPDEQDDEMSIWAMCPYCESEVELNSEGEQPCPMCGLHFKPSQEEIELSKES